jgi:hypothetical protein
LPNVRDSGFDEVGQGRTGFDGLTMIREGDVYRVAHTMRRWTTTTGEVDDAMGIKAEQKKFAHAAGRNWEATAWEELHGAQTQEKKRTAAQARNRPRRTEGHGCTHRDLTATTWVNAGSRIAAVDEHRQWGRSPSAGGMGRACTELGERRAGSVDHGERTTSEN